MRHRSAVTLQFLCSKVQCGNATQLQHNMNGPLVILTFLISVEMYLSGGAKWKNLPDFCLFLIFPLSSDFFSSDFSPLFLDFVPLFPDFWQIFCCQGGTLPPLPLYWLRYWLCMIMCIGIAPLDYCVTLILFDKTLCENCSHISHSIDFCLIPFGKCAFWRRTTNRCKKKSKFKKKNQILIFLRVPSIWNVGVYFSLYQVVICDKVLNYWYTKIDDDYSSYNQ